MSRRKNSLFALSEVSNIKCITTATPAVVAGRACMINCNKESVMDEKRLQEIKGRAYHEASTTEELGWKLNTDKMFDDMKQLIAALEEAHAELDEDDKTELYEMRAAMITSSSAMKTACKKIVNLREQLAEVQAELANQLDEIIALRKQLV